MGTWRFLHVTAIIVCTSPHWAGLIRAWEGFSQGAEKSQGCRQVLGTSPFLLTGHFVCPGWRGAAAKAVNKQMPISSLHGFCYLFICSFCCGSWQQ